MRYQPNQTGYVKTVKLDRLFGFIAPDDHGKDLYFHAVDLLPALPFDEQLQERRVCFDLVDSPRGPRAKNVRGM